MISEDLRKTYVDDFWKYASQVKDVLYLEDAFIDWAMQSKIRVNDLKPIWANINDDVFQSFGLKQADVSFSRIEDLYELFDKLQNNEEDEIVQSQQPEIPSEELDMKDLLNKEIPPSPEEEPPKNDLAPPKIETEQPNIEPEGEKVEEGDLNLTESLLL